MNEWTSRGTELHNQMAVGEHHRADNKPWTIKALLFALATIMAVLWILG